MEANDLFSLEANVQIYIQRILCKWFNLPICSTFLCQGCRNYKRAQTCALMYFTVSFVICKKKKPLSKKKKVIWISITKPLLWSKQHHQYYPHITVCLCFWTVWRKVVLNKSGQFKFHLNMTLFSFPNQKHLHIEHIAFGYLCECFERVIIRSPSAWHKCQGERLQSLKTPEGRQDVVKNWD